MFRLQGCSEDDTILPIKVRVYLRIYYKTVPVGTGAVLFLYILMQVQYYTKDYLKYASFEESPFHPKSRYRSEVEAFYPVCLSHDIFIYSVFYNRYLIKDFLMQSNKQINRAYLSDIRRVRFEQYRVGGDT